MSEAITPSTPSQMPATGLSVLQDEQFEKANELSVNEAIAEVNALTQQARSSNRVASKNLTLLRTIIGVAEGLSASIDNNGEPEQEKIKTELQKALDDAKRVINDGLAQINKKPTDSISSSQQSPALPA